MTPKSDDPQINAFAVLLEAEQKRALAGTAWNCDLNQARCFVRVKPGLRYIRIDVGESGKYMVVHATGEIFGIRAYGVIHRGHAYGTLDTIADWDWSGYHAVKKQV